MLFLSTLGRDNFYYLYRTLGGFMDIRVLSFVLLVGIAGGAFAAEALQTENAGEEAVVACQARVANDFVAYVLALRGSTLTEAALTELNARFAQVEEAQKDAAVTLVLEVFAGQVLFDSAAQLFVLIPVKSLVVEPTKESMIPAVAAAVRSNKLAI